MDFIFFTMYFAAQVINLKMMQVPCGNKTHNLHVQKPYTIQSLKLLCYCSVVDLWQAVKKW